MAVLTELEKQKAKLDAARFNPAKSIQHGDKSVVNRSATDLRMINADLNKEIAQAGGKRRTRQIRFITNRGL